MLIKNDNSLTYKYDDLKMIIEPWGSNSFRIRAWKQSEMPTSDWALQKVEDIEAQINISGSYASITNGKIKAIVDCFGKLKFLNSKDEIILEEYRRTRDGFFGNNPPEDYEREFGSSLEIEGKEFRPVLGGDYQLTLRFESDPHEKIYGLGQYQQPNLNLKGCDMELAQRNSQASVPFVISSLGYGFLWHNPAIGRVTFAKNITSWEAKATKILDYFITVGDTPREIHNAYSQATGCPPMMPEYAMGFWQSKLRYQTQDEIIKVAREYRDRGLPLSVIVIDYFHWTRQGDWKFDKKYWPDPKAMVDELKSMGIETMVSIWPTVDHKSENFEEMKEKGFLIRMDRGERIALDIHGNTVHIDPTNPEAQSYLWNIVEKNYFSHGIKLFWLDEAEPEYSNYDFDIYRYHLGPNLQIGNIYPQKYAETFYNGLRQNGMKEIVNLVRCAWAGSQKYGALVWSGDIHSSFQSLREQLVAGLNIGIAGISWWTTDIGGFIGGNIEDEAFKELFIRWFQFGTFCPVMRSHGYREPLGEPLDPDGSSGGGICDSGADNEVYSYGEEVLDICRKYLNLRERLKPYIKSIMAETHHLNTPVIRPLFYDFPNDNKAWNIEDEYMFGPQILVAPIMEEGCGKKDIYIPQGGRFKNAWTNESVPEGEIITVSAPLGMIPIFIRVDTDGLDLIPDFY